MSTVRVRVARAIARVRTAFDEGVGLVIALVIATYARVDAVQIQEIWTERIGHMALEPELLLSTRDQAKLSSPRIVFFASRSKPANAFLLVLWRRSLSFGPRWLLGPAFRFSQRHGWPAITPPDWRTHHTDSICLDHTAPHVALNDGELARGEQMLDAMGIERGRPFVCLAIRDGAYLNARFPERDWSYHDYRDSDINSYGPMASWLVNAGYSVVRMGRHVEAPFPVIHEHIHDYANSAHRSDFADVFLFSRCDFMISTSTGMDGIGTIFRRPMGTVNTVDINAIQTGSHVRLAMLKDLVDVTTGEQLDLDDDRALAGYSTAGERGLDRLGLQPRECSPDDLVSFAQQLVAILQGTWAPTAEHLRCERMLLDSVPAWSENPPHARFPMGWLESRLGAR